MNQLLNQINSLSLRFRYQRKVSLRTIMLYVFAIVTLSGMAQVDMHEYDSDSDRSIISKIGANHEHKDYPVTNLAVSGMRNRYYSGSPEDWGEGEAAYIEVELINGGLKYDEAKDEDCLLIYTRRAEHINPQNDEDRFQNSHPTAFRVEGFFGEENSDGTEIWHELFYAYFLYRGPYTQEYSSKVLVKKLWKDVSNFNVGDEVDNLPDIVDGIREKALTKLRFYVTANNNRERADEEHVDKNGRRYREMAMARFDVFKVSKGDDYSDTFKDRLHLTTDYIDKYWKYDFENTTGINDPRNQTLYNSSTLQTGLWPLYSNADSIALSSNVNLSLPDFNFIQGPQANPPLEDGQKRQRTHSVEHIIYAIPGDVIGLYPYYEMYNTDNYQQNFSHWYDYRTGKRLTFTAPWSGIEYEMLDFAVNPINAIRTENHGFFATQFLTPVRSFAVSSVEEYIEAVEYINNSDHSCYIELTEDLDFSNRTDIPMLGDSEFHAFCGFFNGNGHTIKGLVYDNPDTECIGFIGNTKSGARIENVILDDNCKFVGIENVGFIGRHFGGYLTVRNIKTEATVIGTRKVGEQAAAGIVGKCSNSNNRITITNCFVGGSIGNPDELHSGTNNAAICAWVGDQGDGERRYFDLDDITVKCKLYGQENGNAYFRWTWNWGNMWVGVDNCVGNQGGDDYFRSKNDSDTDWITTIIFSTINDDDKVSANHEGDMVTGTFATFFCPRNPYVDAGNQESLPFEQFGVTADEEDELIIAADFSQEFDLDHIIPNGIRTDEDGNEYEVGKIVEPIISSRHLFKIRDGRAFAEDFSGSFEANENFVRKNQKMVSARAGVPFQIRFDTPVPKDMVSRSNYYYKISDIDYRRVCTMDIQVIDVETGQDVTDEVKFEPSEPFISQGYRTIEGVKYRLCGSGAEYYRMLKCDNPKSGSYIVRLLGNDVNGEPIIVFGSKDKRLIVMEYNITFLPEGGASMVTENQLYTDNKFQYARHETLEKMYEESGVINFDEYMKINALNNDDLKNKFVYNLNTTSSNLDHSYFKWPVSWDSSNYSFGYSNRHDYNMYMLATHSSVTPYKDAASKFNNNDDGMGLYDRKYYHTKRLNEVDATIPVEQGYFYYVNAATDPGVASRMRIEEICPGSTLHVSAWLSEFSATDETANLSFNFVAVLKDDLGEGTSNENDNDDDNADNSLLTRADDKTSGDESSVNDGIKGGDRIVIHSFITGYVPYNYYDTNGNWISNGGKLSGDISDGDFRGQWLHVYYSFVPRLTEFSKDGITANMVDHYELELDNNCKSSQGADYAIDDIRLYIAKPEVQAIQLSPMCGGASEIRVESPFHTLLQTCGAQEALGDDPGETLTLLYTFIDKQKFDSIFYSDNNEEGNEEGAEGSLSEDDIKDLEKQKYQRAFDASVVKFDYDNRGISAVEKNLYGKLTFKTNLFKNQPYGNETDNKLASYRENETDGRDMIVFKSNLTDDIFSIHKNYYVVLATPMNNNVKEGEEYLMFDITNKCAKICEVTIHASEIVKIDGVLVEDMDQFVVCENQSPVVQVNVWGQKTAKDGEIEMEEIEKNAWFDWYLGSMEDFRKEDGDSHSLYKALSTFRDEYPDKKDFDNVIAKGELTAEMIKTLKDEKKLRLYESSYVVPPVELGSDGEATDVKLVVIPIPSDPVKDMLICTEPTELALSVRNKSPKLQHGFTGITYPIEDVPLRIGLEQLRSGEASGFDMKVVEIPVRTANSTATNVSNLQLVSKQIPDGTESKEGIVLLVSTDDEEYEDLGTIDNTGNETGHLLWVGEVTKLVANISGDTKGNLFNVTFNDDFKFKEGYYYRMRFEYSEHVSADDDGNVGDDNEEPVVCNGHDVFTLKIVPKYLLWTGDRNVNWNNDDNWRRVASAELYADGKYGDAGYRHHVTDGKDADATINNREKSYAPLDFTHVIIPSPVVENNNDNDSSDVIEAPYLYGVTMSNVEVNRGGKTTEYKWPENLETDGSGYADYPENGVGEATSMIQYDMAAYDVMQSSNDDASTACRPWYMNSCKEIHFKPGATIMNQHELAYDKAWVDVELDHSRWYTLATPLKDVFAGDFYLPSDGARQLTELFHDIKFDNTLTTTHRFKPAVYQRGWDKSSAKVYEVDGPGVDADGVRNVVIKANWSLVYNDVAERYDGGVGFSIKTDVSHMETNKPGDDGKVLFRFPKADTEYFYFTQDGSQNGHETTVRTQSNHRLNETNGTISASTATEGKYFLIGNPFMTHMDIQKFLKANEGKLEQKYWIVTAKGQIAGSIDDNGKFIATPVPAEEGKTYAEPTVIAPMQGFFVEAKAARTSLDLVYDESMMRRYDSNKGILTEATRGDEKPDVFRITSYCEGNPTSAAILVTDIASGNDVAAMDNRDLEIPSTVYTAKNGQALSINFCDDAEGVEIGVIADADTKTVLRFDGSETIDGLSLLDKADYTLTPIHEGMEITVDGMAAGRYFLTYGARVEEVFGGIEWSKNNNGLEVCDRASSGYLEVKVYDTLGRLMTSAVSDGERIHIALSHGVYVVEMANGNERKSVKISN